METETEATGSPETLEKLLPQQSQGAQRVRQDLGKRSNAASARLLAVKLRSCRADTSVLILIFITCWNI